MSKLCFSTKIVLVVQLGIREHNNMRLNDLKAVETEIGIHAPHTESLRKCLRLADGLIRRPLLLLGER